MVVFSGIRTALLDSEEHVCFSCKQSDVSPDNLIANKFLRQVTATVTVRFTAVKIKPFWRWCLCLSRLSTTFVTRRDTSVCVKPYRMRHRLYHVPSWSGIYLPDNRIRFSSMRLRPPPQFRPRRLHLLWPQPLLQPKLQPLFLNVPLLPLIPLLLPHLPMRLMKAETLHLPLQQLGIIDHRNSLPITENRLLQGKFRILLMTALKFVSLIWTHGDDKRRDVFVLFSNILNLSGMSQGGWSWSHCNVKLIGRLGKWSTCEFASVTLEVAYSCTDVVLLQNEVFFFFLIQSLFLPSLRTINDNTAFFLISLTEIPFKCCWTSTSFKSSSALR